jgi:hypothetical protein
MSKTKSRRHSGRGNSKWSAADYKVGYGRPPRAHQFKPGQSGNPKGRPRGAKGEDTIFREVISRKVPMSVDGKTRKVSAVEAVWTRVMADALKGNPKAVSLFLNRCRSLDATAPMGAELDQDDRQVLQSYYRQVEAELKAKKEK